MERVNFRGNISENLGQPFETRTDIALSTEALTVKKVFAAMRDRTFHY